MDFINRLHSDIGDALRDPQFIAKAKPLNDEAALLAAVRSRLASVRPAVSVISVERDAPDALNEYEIKWQPIDAGGPERKQWFSLSDPTLRREFFERGVRLFGLEALAGTPANGKIIRGGAMSDTSLGEALEAVFTKMQPHQQGSAIIAFFDEAPDITKVETMAALYAEYQAVKKLDEGTDL